MRRALLAYGIWIYATLATMTTAGAAIIPLPASLAGGDVETATVTDVVDADTVRLDNHKQVRLVGTQGPKLPLGRPNFPAWPLAPEARAHLARLVAGKRVALHYGGAKEDRYGRLLAHLTTEDGGWIQGDMLAAGFARVYSFADNRSAIPEMLALEAQARAGQRGIWANPYYRIRTADDLKGATDSFQVVEGRVLQAANTRDRAYLNFGADYKTDFTVSIAKRDMKSFGRAFDPKIFVGHNVRVRGWVESINGPAIAATHPEQIEVLP